ncbi:MAG: hypothetical protein HQM10_17400 [Candidatus Riflebacteria bacterium]|nr:hypothetical protein [Candidatus Riflebacteria bacterium]
MFRSIFKQRFCSTVPLLMVVFLFALLSIGAASAEEMISQEFSHSLLVNQPSQSWEHRIDLPLQTEGQFKIFIKRKLSLDGRLVIEREELTPTYYYVKVRLPKYIGEFAGGKLTVKLFMDKSPLNTPPLDAPENLKLMEGSAARHPDFIWKGAKKYSAITLYDVDTNQTIWERIILGYEGAGFDEPTYLDLHHYRWAVKQSDETGRWSNEAQAGFRIEEQSDGSVIAIPE